MELHLLRRRADDYPCGERKSAQARSVGLCLAGCGAVAPFLGQFNAPAASVSFKVKY